MALTDTINGEKYDIFIGRAFKMDGDESYVCIHLPSGGGSYGIADERSYPTLIREILYAKEKGEKILMSESPGFEEGKEIDKPKMFYVPFSLEKQRSLIELAQQHLEQLNFLV